MTHTELKNYIKTLQHLDESKINNYLNQVDRLSDDDIPKVYAYLFERTTKYYADIGDAIEKIENEIDEELHKHISDKDKKNLDSIRDSIEDL